MKFATDTLQKLRAVLSGAAAGLRYDLRPRRIISGLLITLAVWALVLAALLLAISRAAYEDAAQPADVIIVLGAGLRADNRPGPALTRRSARAAELWHQGYAPQILCTGGMPGRATRSEADACAELLRADGIPAAAIALEDTSRSTEENAINAKKILDANGWTTALLVSDGFHMLRARWIFAQQGITVFPSPVVNSGLSTAEYVSNTARELIALHWQVFKTVFNIPITYVKAI